jgi:3-oxoacyl-[acyl-carrier-protein] synthase II
MSITTAREGRGEAGPYKSVGNGSRPAHRRVFVTGMGAITPYGPGVDRLWDGLVAGRSAIGPLTAFDPAPYETKIAGEVRDFNHSDFLSQKEISTSARSVQFALASARMALDDARLSLKQANLERIGVFIGSSVGTVEYMAENHAIFLEKGIRRVHPLFPALSYPGVVATQLAITFGVRGPAMSPSSACTSGTDAIGIAWMHIRAGIIDRAIVGGTEAPITPIIFASFDRLGVMSRENENPARASRPFSADRDGFVLSEGAGVCILESEEAAAERGATPLGEVAGYAATSDGFHPFSPLPTGEEGVRAMRLALEAAGVEPQDVDYVNAHAIGSRANDPVELQIIRHLFGERSAVLPVSSIKSMIGHSMGAAGAIELISCVQTLNHGRVPPTINLAVDDQSCAFDLVGNGSREIDASWIISPTFGFGSRNAVLVASRP